MSDLKKATLNALLALASLIATALLWEQTILVTILLVIIAVLVFFVRPSRSTAVVYFVAVLFGPLAEVTAIHHGAWQYASTQLGEIPLWLPFLWGNAGLFLVNTEKLSDILLRKRS